MELMIANKQSLMQRESLEELNKRFIDYLDAKPRTIETYRKALQPFFNYLADKGITQPNRGDILSYRDSLQARLKPTTIAAYMTTVRLFFRWTQQEGLYPNVAEHVKGAKISREHKKDALTSGQVKRILKDIPHDSLQGLRDYALFALMVTGGLRTIEVNRANIGDLRAAGDSAALYIQGKGRDGKDEYIKLPQPVEGAIRAYLSVRGITAQDEPLFASTSNNNRGQRMTTRSISEIIKGRMKAAGYTSDRLTAHSLRHTAATLNLLAGGTLAETQMLLRHSNINTTMIYSHALDRANNHSEQRIAATIF